LTEDARFKLDAYSSGHVPLYWLEIGLAALWVVLWLGFARSKRARNYPWPAIAAPCVVFVFFTWQQTSAASACVG
jgi:hypothetical protein